MDMCSFVCFYVCSQLVDISFRSVLDLIFTNNMGTEAFLTRKTVLSIVIKLALWWYSWSHILNLKLELVLLALFKLCVYSYSWWGKLEIALGFGRLSTIQECLRAWRTCST